MPSKEVARLMRKYKKEELATLLVAAQEQLEKYNQGIFFHTDGTVNGTLFLVDGKSPENIVTVRLRANLFTGIEASYESIKDYQSGYTRNWICGENAELTRFYKEQQALKRKGLALKV